MHEAALAEEVVRIVLEKAGGRRVLAVELLVGEMTSVVPEAMEAAFRAAVEGTAAERAALRIRMRRTKALCGACGRKFRVKDWAVFCPACGGGPCEVVEGGELLVKSITLE